MLMSLQEAARDASFYFILFHCKHLRNIAICFIYFILLYMCGQLNTETAKAWTL